jgi:hypothetical protein
MAETDADTARKPADKPRIWQYLLVPGIIAPLYTAVPVWFDKGIAAWNDYKSGSAIEAQKQMQLAAANMNCLNAPYRYYESVNRLKIDGTICKSGDILVRAMDEEQHPAIYFVAGDIIRDRIKLSHSAARGDAAVPTSAQLDTTRSAMFRRLALTYTLGDGSQAMLQPVQYQVVVLCSQQINQRYLKQRIRRPDGCFDQVIDLANGAVVQITPAPCQC